MLKRTESYWMEGLKFAEDEVRIALLYGDSCRSETFESPAYTLASESNQEQFYQGYYAAIQHYKNTLKLIS